MHTMQQQMQWVEGMPNPRQQQSAPLTHLQEAMAQMESSSSDILRSLTELGESLVSLVGSDSFFEQKMSSDVRKQLARLITQQIE